MCAAVLDRFVESVLQLSSNEADLGNLAEFAHCTMDALLENYEQLDNVLQSLNIQQHSLGVLYVLIAKVQTAELSQLPAQEVMRIFREFISTCVVQQVSIAEYAYYELCHQFAKFIVNKPECCLAIKLLQEALEPISCDSLQQKITPVHADLYMVSLKARNFKVALKYMNIEYNAIATAADTLSKIAPAACDPNMDSKYFLLSYYYAGMIFAAVENYERALYHFEVCINVPATAISAISLEAFKKFILISLIKYGRRRALYKNPVQTVLRTMEKLVEEYLKLESVFEKKNPDALRNVMREHAELFQRDRNMGLVKRVLKALYKFNVKNLKETFVLISLPELTRRAYLPNPADAEMLLLKMIKAGELKATISAKDATVRFREPHDEYQSFELFEKIEENFKKITELVKQIIEMDEKILLDPEFIKKVAASKGKPIEGNQDEELGSPPEQLQ